LIVLPNPLPETLRRAAARCPAGTLPGVPALWRAWHAAGAIPPGVPLAISAGAPLAAALEQSVFADTGVKIHNFYGSSECGGIAYDRSDRPRQEDADAGTPLDQVAVWLGPDDCLCVESGAVGETYWPAPSDTLARGRFQTGDVAELRDGRVWLRGRLHDTINVAGRKAFPATIERALQQHPAVRDCLVFGVPTGEVSRGELVVACFSCRSSVTPAGLRDFLAGRLPAWQVPREWWQVESLETNARGKLSRAEWRDAFLRRSARSKGRAARS
jgi:acyl-CoA synthetase (AMP-forming)/AMP-acid ligase II